MIRPQCVLTAETKPKLECYAYVKIRLMKVVILYRPNSEYARSVEEYVRELKLRTGKSVELVDVDSREGIQAAELYDSVQQPAVLALADDGHLLQSWIGEYLPLINEVSAYAG
jgi:hypothetical protein